MYQNPCFIGIGAEKSATRWICRTLDAHPDIRLPFPYHISFFDRYYDKGLDWYNSQFPSGYKSGEFTTEYLFSEDALQRISSDIEKPKMIVSLRSPVERAFSAYCMYRRSGSETREAVSALTEDSRYIRESLYGSALERYFNVFNPDQFHIIFYEEVADDASRIASGLYDFVGVCNKFVPEELGRVVHRTRGVPRLQLLHRFLLEGYNLSRSVGLPNSTLNMARKSKLVQKIISVNEGPRPERPPAAVMGAWQDYFSNDVKLLESLIGRSVPDSWGF